MTWLLLAQEFLDNLENIRISEVDSVWMNCKVSEQCKKCPDNLENVSGQSGKCLDNLESFLTF